jgi:hypothetical protein
VHREIARKFKNAPVGHAFQDLIDLNARGLPPFEYRLGDQPSSRNGRFLDHRKGADNAEATDGEDQARRIWYLLIGGLAAARFGAPSAPN